MAITQEMPTMQENPSIEREVPIEVLDRYLLYAEATWHSIDVMTCKETGLPYDILHHGSGEKTHAMDQTSPTDIGFYLASVGAAYAMGLISEEEAEERIQCTTKTISQMIKDPEVFINTRDNKGLFVNWIQPSTGKVLKQWPNTEIPVKQQVSTVDMAWFVAFNKLTAVQFPQFTCDIQEYLAKTDLPFMLDPQSGFFCGCFTLNPRQMEAWKYDVLSEARIAYLTCTEDILKLISKLTERKSSRSVLKGSNGKNIRATWAGGYFELGWPQLIVPEDRLHTHWRETYLGTINQQKEFGVKHCNGYYGFSSGLGPDGKYYEFRLPETGECTEPYTPQSVISISAIINMGMIDPVGTFQALEKLQEEFPEIFDEYYGFGDTVDVKTRKIQRDKVFPNQAASLITLWNILKNREPQNLFMQSVSPCATETYQNSNLW